MVSKLKEEILGKKVGTIEYDNCNWGIIFDDYSSITVYTSIKSNLRSSDGENIVTDVLDKDDSIVIKTGSFSEITIVMDENQLVGPEFWVYSDGKGVVIVEN